MLDFVCSRWAHGLPTPDEDWRKKTRWHGNLKTNLMTRMWMYLMTKIRIIHSVGMRNQVNKHRSPSNLDTFLWILGRNKRNKRCLEIKYSNFHSLKLTIGSVPAYIFMFKLFTADCWLVKSSHLTLTLTLLTWDGQLRFFPKYIKAPDRKVVTDLKIFIILIFIFQMAKTTCGVSSATMAWATAGRRRTRARRESPSRPASQRSGPWRRWRCARPRLLAASTGTTREWIPTSPGSTRPWPRLLWGKNRIVIVRVIMNPLQV